jgi:hypothetical protein
MAVTTQQVVLHRDIVHATAHLAADRHATTEVEAVQ